MSINRQELMYKFLLFVSLSSICFSAFSWQDESSELVDPWRQQLLEDVKELSLDKMLGRKAPSSGHQLAQKYLKQRFADLQLKTFPQYENYEQPFTFSPWNVTGKNLLGYLPGTKFPELFFVVTAHYDHLGGSRKRVYNGANDNASGVAAMLALLSHYSAKPPAFSVMFIATDAEESGLRGAMHFVRNAPIKSEQMLLNINLDMIGDGGRRNILYMLAPSKNTKYKKSLPSLDSFTEGLALRLKWRRNLKFQRGSMMDRVNWREASDHAAFSRIKVPFLYFGADTNKLYHTTKDNFAELNQDFFIASATVVIKIVDYLQNLKPSELDERQ